MQRSHHTCARFTAWVTFSTLTVNVAAQQTTASSAPPQSAQIQAVVPAKASTPGSDGSPDVSVAGSSHPAAEASTKDDSHLDEVLVKGARLPGSVPGDIVPEYQLTPADVRSYGVNSVSELVDALAPETAGRSSQPVVLLNGKRIASLLEIADIPTEAILRVDILPGEASLAFGYPANQKVVNIVLRRHFHSLNADLNAGATTEGGRANGAVSAVVTRINEDDRMNISAEYSASDWLLQTERKIVTAAPQPPFSIGGNIAAAPGTGSAEIDPALSALAGMPITSATVPPNNGGVPTLSAFASTAGQTQISDLDQFLTLSPKNEMLRLDAMLARTLPADIAGSLFVRFESIESDALQGLAPITLILPADSPFSPFSRPVALYRYLENEGALRQTTDRQTFNFGLTLAGGFSSWRWSFMESGGYSSTRTATELGFDAGAVQAALAQNNPSVNPYTDLPAALLSRLSDLSMPRSSELASNLLLAGPLFTLPSGSVTTSVLLGASHNEFDSRSIASGQIQANNSGQTVLSARANIDLPIFGRRIGPLGRLGDLSLNLNSQVQSYSMFGTYSTTGYGFRWSPLPTLQLIASLSNERIVPSEAQLNSPLVVTPNVPVFDFATGSTALVSEITGGNPDLQASSRQTARIGVSFNPDVMPSLTTTAIYTRTRTVNLIADLPVSSPETELAFPDRFVRSGNGVLDEVDAQPVNFGGARSEQVRWGFNLSVPINSRAHPEIDGSSARPEDLEKIRALLSSGTTIGDATPGGSAGGNQVPNGPARGTGAGAGAGAPAPSGFPAGAQLDLVPADRGSTGGRFQFALFHTFHLVDELQIAPGTLTSDLLNAAPTGADGVESRHELEGQAGYFADGVGVRLSTVWQSAAIVSDDLGSPSGVLRFSSVTTADLRLFANIDQLPGLIHNHPFLRGIRLTASISNLFDSRREVRETFGATPLAYQPDYIDPIGRGFAIEFRKQFQ